MADSLLPRPKEINMSIGLSELVLILVVVLLLFGGKRIPELAKALGKASYEYKKAKEALENEAASFKETIEKSIEQENDDKKNNGFRRRADNAFGSFAHYADAMSVGIGHYAFSVISVYACLS